MLVKSKSIELDVYVYKRSYSITKVFPYVPSFSISLYKYTQPCPYIYTYTTTAQMYTQNQGVKTLRDKKDNTVDF